MINEDGEFVAPFVRGAYGYDADAVSRSVVHVEPEVVAVPVMQEFRDDADINVILERFGVTGELPTSVRTPLDGDFSDAPDFRTALDLVRQADEAFMTLDAKVRKEFDNDPVKFVEFASDPANRDRARELGLLVPAPVPAEPMAVRVVADKATDFVDGNGAPKAA